MRTFPQPHHQRLDGRLVHGQKLEASRNNLGRLRSSITAEMNDPIEALRNVMSVHVDRRSNTYIFFKVLSVTLIVLDAPADKRSTLR